MTKSKISQLCDNLDSQYLIEIEVDETMIDQKTIQHIEQRVLTAIRQPQPETINNNETKKRSEKKMKKKFPKIAAVAALCLVSATAFAAGGGLSYFTAIFGNSANLIADNIWSPEIETANETYTLTLESMLSDGYKTNMIIGLKSQHGEEMAYDMPFDIDLSNDSEAISISCNEFPDISYENGYLYRLRVETANNIDGETLTIALKENLGDLALTVTVDGVTAAKEITIDAPITDNYTIETIQLSPLGLLIIGSEDELKGALPVVNIDLLMQDGSKKWLLDRSLIVDLDDGSTVTGGGGAIIAGEHDVLGKDIPLATEGNVSRNPDGRVVTNASFGEILDLNQIKAIVINQQEYPLV